MILKASNVTCILIWQLAKFVISRSSSPRQCEKTDVRVKRGSHVKSYPLLWTITDLSFPEPDEGLFTEGPRARNVLCTKSIESFVLHNGTAITERLIIVATDTITKASLGPEGYADKGDVHPGHREWPRQHKDSRP